MIEVQASTGHCPGGLMAVDHLMGMNLYKTWECWCLRPGCCYLWDHWNLTHTCNNQKAAGTCIWTTLLFGWALPNHTKIALMKYHLIELFHIVFNKLKIRWLGPSEWKYRWKYYYSYYYICILGTLLGRKILANLQKSTRNLMY